MENINLPVSQGQPAETRGRADSSTKVCLLTIGGDVYAVDLRNVREAFEVDVITPVPGMPSALVGVTNVRGAVVAVMDLRRMLGVPVTGPTPPYAVIIKHGNHQVGVLVERVPEIRTVQTEQFLPTPSGDAREGKPFLTAVLRLDDRMGGVVEVPTLLACMETES
ncbi:MAG TPA: chemotaxis protein CheW [Nitrospiraceae bacterium]|nr:chemotaxis protein CheW [Nitrospiraceae bacterium]